MNIPMQAAPKGHPASGPDTLRRRLERGLIEQLSSHILKLGKGLALAGSHYPVEVAGQDHCLDLLFYHLRLRCFIALEIEVESLQPRLAQLMGARLSALDNQLRHPNDQHAIGIILRKTTSKVSVEYALRDTTRVMSPPHYRVSSALPKQLKRDLPTAKDFVQDSSAMSVVQLRIEIERALSDFTTAHGLAPDRPKSISTVLRELTERGLSPPSTDRFLNALRIMNEAAHGFAVDSTAMAEAVSVGTAFLAELTSSTPRTGGS